MLGLVIQKGQGGLCRQRQQVKECHVNINYTKKVEVTPSFFFLKLCFCEEILKRVRSPELLY